MACLSAGELACPPSVSDRKSLALTARSGTPSAVAHDGWQLGALVLVNPATYALLGVIHAMSGTAPAAVRTFQISRRSFFCLIVSWIFLPPCQPRTMIQGGVSVP